MIKRKKNYYLLLFLLLSIIYCFFIFSNSAVLRDDMNCHLNRIYNIKTNLTNGYILPTISQNVFNNYGYADEIFYPCLFLYIPALFNLLGINIVNCYQIFLIIITFFTFISMFYTMEAILSTISKHIDRIISTDRIALISSILYGLMPYRLFDLYVRNALGELQCYIFIPIIAYALFKMFYEEKTSWRFLTLGMCGIAFSHIITLLTISVCVLIIFLFNITKTHNKKFAIYQFVKSIITSILISAICLFPILEMLLSDKYKLIENSSINMLELHSIKFFSDFNTATHSILTIIFIILTIFLFLCIRKDSKLSLFKKLVLYFLLSDTFTILFSSNLIPWNVLGNINCFSFIQFPWRIFIISDYITMLFFTILIIKIINKNFIFYYFTIFILVLTQVTLIALFLTTFQFNNNMKKYTYYKDTFTCDLVHMGLNDYLPYNFNTHIINTNSLCINTLNNEYIHCDYKLDKNSYIFNLNINKNNLDLEMPIVYYKGYNAYINNTKIPIQESKNGLIEINTTNFKSGIIIIRYEHTFIQKFSLLLTLIGLFFLILSNYSICNMLYK